MSEDPSAVSLLTDMAPTDDCTGFTSGKSDDVVKQPTITVPAGPRPMPEPISSPLPPSKVEKTTPEPSRVNSVTKASEEPSSAPPSVVGKSGDDASPVT